MLSLLLSQETTSMYADQAAIWLGRMKWFCFPPALSFTTQGLAAASFYPTGVDHTSKQALEGAQVSEWKGKGKTLRKERWGERENEPAQGSSRATASPQDY